MHRRTYFRPYSAYCSRTCQRADEEEHGLNTYLADELEALARMNHIRWEDGLVSGAVYHGQDDLLRLQADAFARFTLANPRFTGRTSPGSLTT